MPRLTENQKKFIKENYRSMDTKEIAKQLDIPFSRVQNFASHNSLTKGCRSVCLTKEQEKYILSNYKTKTTKEISLEIGCSIRDINRYADYENLIFDSNKYNVDENYFSEINTPNKAYRLGFLYADGCVLEQRNKHILEISLNSEDKTHLEKFKMCLKSNAPIKDKTIKEKYHACRITICNDQICKDLIKLGCVPRKSLILKFPTEEQVPSEFISHFIRGYFDGDGCIYNNKELKKSSVSFVGTKDFLTGIQKIVHKELGLSETTISQRAGKSYVCDWCGYPNIKTWFDYLYKGDDLMYLQRKFEKFLPSSI